MASFTTHAFAPYSQHQHSTDPNSTNPIDLTIDDDDDELQILGESMAKRPRIDDDIPPLTLHAPLPSLSQSSSTTSLSLPQVPMLYASQPLPRNNGWSSQPLPPIQPRPAYSQPIPSHYKHQWSPNTIFQPSPQHLQQLQHLQRLQQFHPQPHIPPIQYSSIHQPLQQTYIQPMQTPRAPSETIDLTAEPSTAEIADLKPKDPLLIGQLAVTTLVLYPSGYLVTPRGYVINSPTGEDWASIKLRHDPTLRDTNIRCHVPPQKESTIVQSAEHFGVLEKKASAALLPLVKDGLVRLDAKVKRSSSGTSPTVMQTAILVFTPKGNMPHVAAILDKHGVQLDHPTSIFDIQTITQLVKYFNPHGPPPGGFRNLQGKTPRSTPAPQVATKSVNVQRSQMEDMFQSLRGEEDLAETEPGPCIATSLYPHQKKAVTFLLEREQEMAAPAGKMASLWARTQSGHYKNAITGETTWKVPKECKAALLADDMGLGKSLETISLLAATLKSAQQFGKIPLEPPEPPADPEDIADLSVDHFAGRVWDMPIAGGSNKAASIRAKQKAAYEKALMQYNRLTKLKERSRATLIICPVSTLASWEDQFRDHWGGDVIVVGGISSTAGSGGAGGIGGGNGGGGGGGTQMTLTELFGGAMNVSDNSKASSPVATPKISKPGAPIRIYIYHGTSRRPDPSFIANFDVVLTTYSTLSTEYSKQSKQNELSTTQSILDFEEDLAEGGISSDGGIVETDEHGNPLEKKVVKKKVKRKRKPIVGDICSPLQAIYWFRVVLDEAHSIKETSTVASRACCDLVADRRLCLTGTPVQNKLDDLYALIKFLRVEPLDDKLTWTNTIGNLVKFNDQLGITKLQTLMRLLTLRRTKDTKGKDGKPILSLPPRQDSMVLLKLSPEEREVYDSHLKESKDEISSMGRSEIMRNYVNILQKILRLRQICDDLTLLGDAGSKDAAAQYEEVFAGIAKEGLNLERATAVFNLLRETATSQCVECGYELAVTVDGPSTFDDNEDGNGLTTKRKGKFGSSAASVKSSRASSPSNPNIHPIITRCTHLFCICCFRAHVIANWPCVAKDAQANCTVCQTTLNVSVDVVQVCADGALDSILSSKKKDAGAAKKEKRKRGAPIVNYKPSTKVQALIQDLMQFSKMNRWSANYDPDFVDEQDVQIVDEKGKAVDEGITKSVVFSQWTSMLDKIEEALEMSNIHFERLDGTMKREERSRSMDALKKDPRCEVLLVSLKAGGVGLTLTAASRVYLMDPYWNPAVENQAVDRIHRLGQTKPVTAIKYIIEDSIEQRLLEVQKTKADLAKLTLGKPLSKQELQERRLQELSQLLG